MIYFINNNKFKVINIIININFIKRVLVFLLIKKYKIYNKINIKQKIFKIKSNIDNNNNDKYNQKNI